MQKESVINISINDLPEEFQQLFKPPSSLNVCGNVELLKKRPRVGIIGARKYTPYGREVTISIATALARAGVTIVSGMALGIDSIAHKACLEANGQTIAVLPSGLKRIYPASHAGLAQQIMSHNGLLISEYPYEHRPMRHHFLERNRLIAALSDLLIITEAGLASGSLNTARFGLELGTTIMAVPGPITSPYSAGTNRLIQTGAIPLLDPADILNQLGITETEQRGYLAENETEQLLLSKLKEGVNLTNELISATGLETSLAQTHLSMLEIKGAIIVQNGRWSLL